MSDEERVGGRMAFSVFLVAGVLWLVASGFAHWGENVSLSGWIGAGVLVVIGVLVGSSIGFYNLGRRRGR